VRIWIDVTSLPHVSFFRALIKRLEKSGEEVVVTSRDFGMMNDMLERSGIDYTSVGSHGGKDRLNKLLRSSERGSDLARMMDRDRPDIGLGKHSVECARVCFGLGIPSVTVIDHETAEMQTRLIAPLSDIIISPEAVPAGALRRFGAREISRFYGVCETAHFHDFRPSGNVLKELGLSARDKIIIARSEPLLSAHNFQRSLLFPVLGKIKGRFPESKIVLVPRGESDLGKLMRLDPIIPEASIDTLSLYSYASLMIGGGSCMNREASIGGCPTISICPDRLPGVDRLLIQKGIMRHSLEEKEIVGIALQILESTRDDGKVRKVTAEFKDPYDNIMEVLGRIKSA